MDGGERESEHLRQRDVGGGLYIVGWYNTGQEESILLTVKIHLVRTKYSNRPELSNRPYLLPVLSGWGGFSLKTLYLSLCVNEDPQSGPMGGVAGIGKPMRR